MRIPAIVEGLLQGDFSTSNLANKRHPELRTGLFVAGIFVLGIFHGACVGIYGLRWATQYGWFHLVAVMLKVPLLFLLTLVVTLPSLYVFAALGGSRLRFLSTLRLFLAATTLALTVLASLGPVIVFFTFSTSSHPFMQILNAIAATLAGLVALRFLKKRLGEAAIETVVEEPDGSRRTQRSRVGLVFASWLVVYALVGAQMGWIMRPFVGSPKGAQVLFRDVESNIFKGLAQALKYL